AQLDLSGETLISLKESSWNQNLIYQLARRAQAVAERSETRNLYLLPKEEISWDELVKDRIHRILREVHHQRTTDSDISKKRSRSVRLWKHNRRQSLAVLAGQACQEKGDTEGEDSWGFLLCAIGSLQVDGMSDEEDGEEDGNPVRLVLNAAFRRKEFRPLFRFIDSNPAGIEKGQGGRRFKKRVEIAKEVSPSRKLLNTIPSAFLSPAYQSQGYQGAAKDVEVNFSKMLRYFHKEGRKLGHQVNESQRSDSTNQKGRLVKPESTRIVVKVIDNFIDCYAYLVRIVNNNPPRSCSTTLTMSEENIPNSFAPSLIPVFTTGN
ncbi:hypothetical protein EV360DRAFT_77145, partial [Lentinula raphanica]